MRVPAQPALALALVLSLLLACAQAAPPAATPAPPSDPDIQAMIEALMPSAARSMRNLVVRQRAEEMAAASAPAAASASATAGAPAPPAVAVVPADSAASAASTAVLPATSGAVVVPTPSGPPPSLALAIQFERNSSRVRPASGPVLGSLVAAMQSAALKSSRFVIEGHADPRGAPAQNQRLSQERADEVRLYLVSLGVHPARLRAVGKGASQLVNAGDPGAAENRRVRVVTVE
ncbi:MAG: OmpA family protein [Rubrivivax sp.]|nr:OmpA family protein [Rubrivivax sp.]